MCDRVYHFSLDFAMKLFLNKGRSIWKRLCAEDTISDVFFKSNAHSRQVQARAILVDTEEMVRDGPGLKLVYFFVSY